MSDSSLHTDHGWFRQLFELSPDPTWIIDGNQFVECNGAAIRTLGYASREELLNVHPSKLSPPKQADGEDSFAKAERMMALSKANGLHRFEWMHRRADGSNFVAEVTLSCIKLANREVICAVWRDINDVKQSQQLQIALYSISEAAHAAVDLPSLLEQIHLIVGKLMPADNFFVALYDEQEQMISFPYFVDEKDPAPLPRRIGQGGLTEQVLRTGEALLLTPESMGADGGDQSVVGTDSLDWLGVPLKTEKRTVGVLAVQSYSGMVRYTERDKSLLEFVSEHVAMTIERKQAESRLKLAASVFTHAREGIMITDAAGTIIDVNETFTGITGYSREEALGQNPRILGSGRHGQEFFAAMWRELLAKGHWYGEIWNRRKDGEVYAEILTISAVRDSLGTAQHYVALFTDITSLKEYELELEHIAHYDALTSLPNRVLLADRLQQGMVQSLRRGQPLAVAYLDLDGFKPINDTYGHDVGDALLMSVARRMKQVLREGDTLARLGGDEFVAVLLDLPGVAASLPLLARLLKAADQPVQLGDLALQVSASIGVTFYPQAEDVDSDQLLRQADQAMYQAKLAGKNRYHIFDAEHDRSVRGHHESLEHIRRALAANEFVLYYQPKVNMRTGTITGAEALIRWQHPERGLLLPGVFLPVIEQHALAVTLGEWVIDGALAQIERWHAVGLNIPVSVNVGARQLQQVNFVERLGELLAAHPGVKPGELEMEVLETSALEDLARVSQIIIACQEIGVHFALDDFGAGYSSLTYLKHLPVTLLKIDQSFVRNMLDDPDDLAILESVLGLATAFRREVIAEGVETLDHAAMLLQLGCDLAQGYGIARPMPASSLAPWVASWRPDPAWADLPAASGDDLPLLFASAEHRAWIARIESHLQGRQRMPELDHNQCRFGIWLEGPGRLRYGAQPSFRSIAPLHREVHALATELCQLHQRGETGAALAGLARLHHLRDALLAELKAIRLEPVAGTSKPARPR